MEGLVGAGQAAWAGAGVAVDVRQPVEAVLCAAHHHLAAVWLAQTLRPAGTQAANRSNGLSKMGADRLSPTSGASLLPGCLHAQQLLHSSQNAMHRQ
jgi:hypothetical protein